MIQLGQDCFGMQYVQLYTSLCTSSGKSYPVDLSLDQIGKLIDLRVFFRNNRNLVVSYQAIVDIIAYSSGRLKLVLTHSPGPDDVVVSRERVSDFKDWMDRWWYTDCPDIQ